MFEVGKCWSRVEQVNVDELLDDLAASLALD